MIQETSIISTSTRKRLLIATQQINCMYSMCSMCSMCSLAVSTQDSPAIEPRSNPGSGKILISENPRLYTTSPVVMC